jgi:hypothetical protein
VCGVLAGQKITIIGLKEKYIFIFLYVQHLCVHVFDDENE